MPAGCVPVREVTRPGEIAERLHAARRRQELAALRLEMERAASQLRTGHAWNDGVYSVLTPEQVERTPRRIVARTAEAFGVTVEDLRAPRTRRRPHFVAARWAAIAAVKQAHPGYSLPRLGKLINAHHTTILHALRRMAEIGVPQPPQDSGGRPCAR